MADKNYFSGAKQSISKVANILSPTNRNTSKIATTSDLLKTKDAIGMRIRAIDAEIKVYQGKIGKLDAQSVTAGNSNAIKSQKEGYYTKISKLQAEKAQLNKRISVIDGSVASSNKKAASAKGTSTTTPAAKKVSDGKPRVNLSATKENYFTPSGFLKDTLESDTNVPAYYTPDGKSVDSTAIKTAQNLWAAGSSSKGVIQTWSPQVSYSNSTVASYANSNSQQNYLDSTVRAFQFHYNPGSVSMVYRGVPDTDVSLYSANIEKFNLMSPSTNMSTIDFSLVVNRMTDMHYIASSGDYKKPGINYRGSVYTREPVINSKYNELKDIYDKGTMYDVEYLLHVLVGYQLHSALRKGGLTPDMGWVSPRPVELHLGNNLRYLVFINGFQIDHAIFNERMVPLLTTIKLSGTRIPDYDGANFKKA